MVDAWEIEPCLGCARDTPVSRNIEHPGGVLCMRCRITGQDPLSALDRATRRVADLREQLQAAENFLFVLSKEWQARANPEGCDGLCAMFPGHMPGCPARKEDVVP